jgi:hypothetical protein
MADGCALLLMFIPNFPSLPGSYHLFGTLEVVHQTGREELEATENSTR